MRIEERWGEQRTRWKSHHDREYTHTHTLSFSLTDKHPFDWGVADVAPSEERAQKQERDEEDVRCNGARCTFRVSVVEHRKDVAKAVTRRKKGACSRVYLCDVTISPSWIQIDSCWERCQGYVPLVINKTLRRKKRGSFLWLCKSESLQLSSCSGAVKVGWR